MWSPLPRGVQLIGDDRVLEVKSFIKSASVSKCLGSGFNNHLYLDNRKMLLFRSISRVMNCVFIFL